jgi:hypothetical protein
MDLSYAWSKCGTAVEILASRDGPIQRRLRDAIRESLHYARNHLPESLRDELDAIEREANKIPAVSNEGTLEATMRAMSAKDASMLAIRIVSFADDVTQHFAIDRFEKGLARQRRPLPDEPSSN